MKRIIILFLFLLIFLSIPVVTSAAELTLYYPPDWAERAPKAKAIAEALSQSSGLTIQPRIAQSRPEIIEAFSQRKPALVFVGSFVQAMLFRRGLSVPIVQGVNGKEFYTSVLIAPSSAGTDPKTIVKNAGSAVAYAKGTSAGESAAKAATGGKAEIAMDNPTAAVNAVKTGRAKCAFVKKSWWEERRANFEGINHFDYPGVSEYRHPDLVLSANKAVSSEDLVRIKLAALKNANVFGVRFFREFDPSLLEPTIDLMKRGKIDPKTYTW
ncbi:MAG: PhnD/SsuA/transferrin family substrate-binding protein [Syntrophaceae bacterium]|nr:PhnD/SsuA/transferrin family substrate-binding protein [Syntrophaceae bacterium]